MVSGSVVDIDGPAAAARHRFPAVLDVVLDEVIVRSRERRPAAVWDDGGAAGVVGGA